jgi:hypothetical protein
MDYLIDNCGSAYSSVSAHFDKILEKHFSRKNEAGSADMVLPIKVSVISCLLLLAGRENEINISSGSPPARYTKDTLSSDLVDIGLHVEDEQIAAIRELVKAGYVEIGGNGRYHARKSALILAESIDNAFTGMPGLSLVAYSIQTIEEVLSGRKDIDFALDQFEQTLSSRMVRSTAGKKSCDPDEPGPKSDLTTKRERGAGENFDTLKQANLRILSKIRSRTPLEFAEPMILTRNGYSGKAEIKEIFPRSPFNPERIADDTSHIKNNISEEISPQFGIADQHSENSFESFQYPNHSQESSGTPESDTEVLQADRGPESVEHQETSRPPQEISDKEILQKTGISHIEASHKLDMAKEHAAGNLISTPIDNNGTGFFEPGIISESTPDDTARVISEDIVEKRIEVFQETLAMNCPLCGSGKILSKTTEKEKAYFVCSNESCNLITWGKPYHFRCPSCNNPFLIEFTDKDGNIGLKCPRATCSYRQKNLDTPLKNNGRNLETAVTDTQKRRGKVVRKRLVRRKS